MTITVGSTDEVRSAATIQHPVPQPAHSLSPLRLWRELPVHSTLRQLIRQIWPKHVVVRKMLLQRPNVTRSHIGLC